MTAVSAQTRANRSAGGRAGGSVPAAVKQARAERRAAEGLAVLAEVKIDLATRGTGPRGPGEKMGFSPADVMNRILSRIRAGAEGHAQ